MTPVTDRSFGLLIAYVIPGFSVIWLWGQNIPAVATWLAANPSTSPSVGGFLYVTVASIAAGLLLSTVRWAIVDRLHHATGLVPPRWTYASDPASLEAYRLVVDLHYRYYQFYGSALLVFVLLLLVPPGGLVEAIVTTMVARLAIVAGVTLFFAASRDTLSKCYSRGSSGDDPTDPGHERTDAMTNGGHYGHVTPNEAGNLQKFEQTNSGPAGERPENDATDGPQESRLGAEVEIPNAEIKIDSLPRS